MKIKNNILKLSAYAPGEQPQESGWIKLNTNENPYPPSPLVLEAIKREANESLKLYPDPLAKKLREKISEVFNVSDAQVVFGNGSDELIDILIKTFVSQNEKVVSCYPSYGLYSVASKIYNVKYEEIDLNDDFTFPLEKIIAAKAKLTFICNPNSPTGTFLPTGKIGFLCKNLKDGLIVVDEAYNDFAEESAVKLTKIYDNLIVIRTFSKSFSLCGMRIGYAIGPKNLIKLMQNVRQPYNLDRLSIAAGVAALEDSNYLKENTKKIIAGRKFIENELKKLGFKIYPSQSNFIFVESKPITAKELYLKLKETKILVRYWDKRRLSNCLRISVGNEKENVALINAVKEILSSCVYEELNGGITIQKNAKVKLKSVDAVVLDIDGVLIDVSKSYRRAIAETTGKYLNSIGYSIKTPRAKETRFLKSAGGFNNDWNCTYGLTLFYLLKLRKLIGLNLEDFSNEIKNYGGGFNSVIQYAKDTIGNAELNKILKKLNKKKIKSIFQKLYLGENFNGFVSSEPILISKETMKYLLSNFKVGVLTGRPKKEALYALNKIGLKIPLPYVITMDDLKEEQQKPSPYALLKLKELLNSNTLAYVGDTIDDIRAVNNAIKNENSFLSIGVLTGAFSDKKTAADLRAENSSVIMANINSISKLLGER